jgi:N6-L-threonylcarbamoyladenine synthase
LQDPVPETGRDLTLLGLETSCDETAAAVVRRSADGRVQVLSSIIASQIAQHAPFGGVVPEIAARAHVEVIDAIAGQAMATAGLGYDQLDGVAATAGPGCRSPSASPAVWPAAPAGRPGRARSRSRRNARSTA